MTDQTKKIVIQESDGSISILNPSPNSSLTIEEIQAKDVPDGLNSFIVDSSSIPADRSFRDSWTYTN